MCPAMCLQCSLQCAFQSAKFCIISMFEKMPSICAAIPCTVLCSIFVPLIDNREREREREATYLILFLHANISRIRHTPGLDAIFGNFCNISGQRSTVAKASIFGNFVHSYSRGCPIPSCPTRITSKNLEETMPQNT